MAGELIAFATFFTGQWALSAQHLDVTLAHPGALRGVLAAGFYLAMMAWVGLGLGAVIRHTAGAITALVGWSSSCPRSSTRCPHRGTSGSAGTR